MTDLQSKDAGPVQDNPSMLEPINESVPATPAVPDDRDAAGRRVPRNRCHAHKKSGAQCKRPAIPGGKVCRHHGGAAPHVQNAARVRLEMAADKAAAELIGMAIDSTGHLFYKRPDVKLAAINSLLDRAGLKPTDKVEVTQDNKPFERLVNALSETAELTREQSRQLRAQQMAQRESNTEDAEEVPLSEGEG